ncbi:hypothetical protein OG884_34710 [Streptosporangium sp. NBC_01755]|uniref:hypothetical protein n=1 Tax=Streptosporangium sp. NBC_01755 TaxID=2975949 RepID=UPI002DD7D403|nr:hypothetical protein [Streptosporangium sp. NBC_01755]WSC99883.1 hypothetical protein OG884_34710 [Streptosporangium sp. NBC_01755]
MTGRPADLRTPHGESPARREPRTARAPREAAARSGPGSFRTAADPYRWAVWGHSTTLAALFTTDDAALFHRDRLTGFGCSYTMSVDARPGEAITADERSRGA